MIKIVLFGLFVHLIFLASIFQIYFQSPVIENIHPQPHLDGAPAKRLVLFVADGLRAESFLRDDLQRTPFLRDTILNRGIFGISHTHVPTESRPGHVALIAGFYEDPSAVLKGWQHNPVDFDSVFNRSTTTYAWGSPDIMSIFNMPTSKNFVAKAYTRDMQDFSGKSNTSSLDSWVFEKADEFVRQNSHQIADKDRIVFFLHLLGLDTAGHVHKPNSDLFDDNIREVDKGIKMIAEQFNQLFPDGRTAFVFTADHGMSNKGGHGAGSTHETETPIIAWGSGVTHWKNVDVDSTQPSIQLNGVNVPRFDIEQADVSVLMSSVIGSSIPTNNRGRLPLHYVNATQEYRCRSVLHNQAQITTIFKHLHNKYKKAVLFKEFSDLSENSLMSMEYAVQKAFKVGNYDEAEKLSYRLIDLALDGIEYFQSYYQNLLLLTVSISMIGWMLFLVQMMGMKENRVHQSIVKSKRWNIYWIAFFAAMCLIAYAQQMTLADGMFFVLPIFCWYPVKTYKMFRHLNEISPWIWIAGVELLVFSFFCRPCLSGILIGLVAYEYVILKDKKEKLNPFFNWALNNVVLAIYPSLPLVNSDSNNIYLLLIGLGAWTLKIFYAAARDANVFKSANFVVFSLGVMNFLCIIWDLDQKQGLHEFKQTISWISLISSLILPTLSSNSLRDRLSAIISSLALPFALMSLSYEPLFFMTFSSCVYYWVSMIYTDKKHLLTQQSEHSDFERSIEPTDFKRAYICILYVLVSFFGTGNIASISSFDPNWVRCFVSTFAPFLMASLIILKLLTPILLVMCAVRQIQSITKIPLDKFFIIILLCCDIMCLNFLFLVKNTGSWLEIGTSISHFVIMESTIVVLCLLQLIAVFLTTYQLQTLLWIGKARDLSENMAKIE